MSAKQDFLKAIWEQPHDDLPRLVYADWLEEQGDAARAEFIRLQCEYARTEKYEDHWYTLGDRVEKMWKKHKKTWQAELPESVRKYRFERGFVAPPRRDITAAKFMAMTEEDLAAAPLWRFAITGRGKSLTDACQHPNFARVQGLYHHDSSSTEIDGVFESKYLQNLTCIWLSGPSTKNHTVELICSRTADMPYLTELNFRLTRLSNTGMQVLVDSPLMSRLTVLDAYANTNLSLPSVTHLTESNTSRNLRNLSIHAYVDDHKRYNANDTQLVATILNGQYWTKLNQYLFNFYHAVDPIEALLASTPVFQLRNVTFPCQFFDEKDYVRLMQWPGLKYVRDLSLWSCDMNPVIARIVAESPYLDKLKRLNFTQYVPEVKAYAQPILQNRFGKIDETTLK